MFTTIDKALVGIIMGVLFILNSYFGVHLGFTEEQVTSFLAIILPVLIYFIPNKTVAPPPSQ